VAVSCPATPHIIFGTASDHFARHGVAVIDLSLIVPKLAVLSHQKEDAMAIEPGDVVTLKSGGHAMTVAAIEENNVECLWIGEEGELFRETIPSVVLMVLEDEEEEDEAELDVEDEDDEEAEHDDEHEEEEDDDEKEPSSKKKRRSA
jgi:uncharacterized protein YodC (DUF2158 family)